MSFKTIQNVLPYLCLLTPGMVLSETVEPSVNQADYSYETRQHETVVVTANRVSRTTNNAISSVKVITREDIVNSQARSVPALLKGLAGVHITQNGGRGSNTSLFLRGTNSDHVIVLVDGIKIGSATSGTASFQHYPLEQIDRIDIRKNKGVVKFIFKNFHEIQLDGATGNLLQIGFRSSDVIENIHDGSILDDYFNTSGNPIKLIYTSVMGIALLLFTITGFWLWYGPKKMRRTA